MLIKLTAGSAASYSFQELCRDNPNISFSASPDLAFLATLDVYDAIETSRPAYDHTKNVSETFQEIGGQWTQVWVETPASQAEIAERVADQWSSVRAERNARLSACDWTQLADANVDATAWAIYRQALRDLPQTQSDPFAIVWPATPV